MEYSVPDDPDGDVPFDGYGELVVGDVGVFLYLDEDGEQSESVMRLFIMVDGSLGRVRRGSSS